VCELWINVLFKVAHVHSPVAKSSLAAGGAVMPKIHYTRFPVTSP